LPRLGKIRLGIKKLSAKGVPYPAEVDYFILDPETSDQDRTNQLKKQFVDLYGDKPKRIKIMFPPAAPELFFAQWYKRYGSGSLLKCKGDGEIAETTQEFAAGLEKIGETERGFIQVKCNGPECVYQTGNNEFCPKPQCATMGALQVILPELSGIGVWQISTGSYNSIVNINSALEWIKGLCGRYAMIPLWLMRVPQDIAYEGKKSKHYILQIDQNISIGEIQKFVSLNTVERALIPGPDEKKDDLFYDKNGERPQLPAPEEVDTPENAQKGPTINDTKEDKPDGQPINDLSGADTKPEPEGQKKPGPLAQEFEKHQKSRKVYLDLKAGIETMKTKKTASDYMLECKNKGYIDKMTDKDRVELKTWAESYLKGLKI